MEAVAWFIAGGIAAAAGIALGVIVGSWASWMASIVFGALVVAASRRVSAFSSASLVAGVTGAYLADGVLLAVVMALASMVLVTGVSLAYVAAWLSGLRAIARCFGHVEGYEESASAVDEGSTTPRDTASVGARARGPSDRHARTGLLTSARVDRLVRIAAQDSDAFRVALAELSTLQRQQVHQALSGRRRVMHEGL